MPPMKTVQPSRYVLFLLIAIGGCAADLLTKSWIFDRLKMPHRQPTEWLWQGVFGFTTSLNEGALFGNAHVHSTNGYESRRQDYLSLGSTKLKAASAASAIALVTTKLAPG